MALVALSFLASFSSSLSHLGILTSRLCHIVIHFVCIASVFLVWFLAKLWSPGVDSVNVFVCPPHFPIIHVCAWALQPSCDLCELRGGSWLLWSPRCRPEPSSAALAASAAAGAVVRMLAAPPWVHALQAPRCLTGVTPHEGRICILVHSDLSTVCFSLVVCCCLLCV